MISFTITDATSLTPAEKSLLKLILQEPPSAPQEPRQKRKYTKRLSKMPLPQTYQEPPGPPTIQQNFTFRCKLVSRFSHVEREVFIDGKTEEAVKKDLLRAYKDYDIISITLKHTPVFKEAI